MSTLYFSIIVQAIGLLSVVCFMLSFQIKSNKALFICQMAGAAFFCLQYLLLGGITGCLTNFAGIVRNVFLTNMDKHPSLRWKGWPCIFTAISITIMIFTWEGLPSIFPTIAYCVASFALWTDNAQKIRFFNLICISPCFLIYGIIYGSIGGIITELFIITSIIVSIYRYGWKAMGAGWSASGGRTHLMPDVPDQTSLSCIPDPCSVDLSYRHGLCLA